MTHILCNIILKMTENKSVTVSMFFYVMNKNESELILSLFTLKKKNIYIDCELMI